MSQFFIRSQSLQGNFFRLTDQEAYHLIRVWRKKSGDKINLFDESGSRYQALLTRVDLKESHVEGQILSRLKARPRPYTLRLFQGMTQGSKFDFVVEKATELGVDQILPFQSEKSLVKMKASQVSDKRDRWSRLAQAAAKQCNREGIPIIQALRPLYDLEKELQEGASVVLWEKEEQATLKEQVKSLSRDYKTLNVLIGPEGGFNQKEIDWLRERKVQPVSLGTRILRSETAGLVVLSILNYELDLF